MNTSWDLAQRTYDAMEPSYDDGSEREHAHTTIADRLQQRAQTHGALSLITEIELDYYIGGALPYTTPRDMLMQIAQHAAAGRARRATEIAEQLGPIVLDIAIEETQAAWDRGDR